MRRCAATCSEESERSRADLLRAHAADRRADAATRIAAVFVGAAYAVAAGRAASAVGHAFARSLVEVIALNAEHRLNAAVAVTARNAVERAHLVRRALVALEVTG